MNMDVRLDLVFSALMMAFAFVGGDWTTNCPTSCKCIWSDGKKTAECQDAGFSAVPSSLSPELQIINMNRNNLHSLPSQTFKSVNLFHLHKIFMKNCSIELIDKNALTGMVVLIEIDLSYNNIRHLHRDLFKECEKIREVRLSNNPIEKLENGLFSNLEFLQTVDFSGCKLHEIDSQVFWNVPALTTLELKGNLFTNLQLGSVEHLHKLKNFGLTDNPWKCDCKLRPLRNWAIRRNLYSVPTSCKEPPHMKDLLWNEVADPDEFSCRPNIVSLTREPHGILACLVEGDPLPTVTWTFNNKLVTNHSLLGSDFVVQESTFGGFKWSNLTLRNSRGKDNGEYKCIAKSFGGQEEVGKEVKFDPYVDGDSYYGSSDASYENWIILVDCIVGVLVLIVIILLVKCYVCRRRRRSAINRNKKDKESANGSVTHVIDSEEKNLINVINPLQKPPRTANASANSSETEFHDSNVSQYNENGSVKGSIALDNKDQSLGSVITFPKSRLGEDGDASTDHCPPDLLAFPGKKHQNPTSDGLPFVTSSDRSPYPRPQKLLNSPQYSGQFGTLPYSRSHSPFSPPLSGSRQSGYVTIPRKPRVPSWSSPLSPVVIDTGESVKSEPIYDNLGPRTTADGSSGISLNKCDGSTPVTYKNRPLPLTPLDSAKRFYEPISENGTFSPVLKNSRTPNADKTPRDSSTPDNKRQSWARITPEGAQVHSTEETESLIAPNSVNPRITNRKIPPNPPPKPKKKPGKAFYEDEGEDGTEV